MSGENANSGGEKGGATSPAKSAFKSAFWFAEAGVCLLGTIVLGGLAGVWAHQARNISSRNFENAAVQEQIRKKPADAHVVVDEARAHQRAAELAAAAKRYHVEGEETALGSSAVFGLGGLACIVTGIRKKKSESPAP